MKIYLVSRPEVGASFGLLGSNHLRLVMRCFSETLGSPPVREAGIRIGLAHRDRADTNHAAGRGRGGRGENENIFRLCRFRTGETENFFSLFSSRRGESGNRFRLRCSRRDGTGNRFRLCGCRMGETDNLFRPCNSGSGESYYPVRLCRSRRGETENLFHLHRTAFPAHFQSFGLLREACPAPVDRPHLLPGRTA